MKTLFLALFTAVALFAQTVSMSDIGLEKQVRHAVLMYPYYSMFDYITFTVANGKVTFSGFVTRDSKKFDLSWIAKHIPAIVDNEVEVLPPSPMDEKLRQDVAQSIFSFDGLSHYFGIIPPPIHVIVKNSHVALYGIVDNAGDKEMIGERANGVLRLLFRGPRQFGLAPVENNLTVVLSNKKK